MKNIKERHDSLRKNVLSHITENFKFKPITILYNSLEHVGIEEVHFVTKILGNNAVCVSIHYIRLNKATDDGKIKNITQEDTIKCFPYSSKSEF